MGEWADKRVLQYTTVAVLQRRLSLWKMLLHWFICFWGNLAGALFVTLVIFGGKYALSPPLPQALTGDRAVGGVFDTDPYRAETISFATKKQITPMWHQIFLRGIGCNWLVCLACFLGMQGRNLTDKLVGIWWPIFAFVGLGLDHVVANMYVDFRARHTPGRTEMLTLRTVRFFIPIGIWVATPHLTVGLYIWKGIIPAGLGNLVGGALFCGGYYWWMYLAMEPPVAVDGVVYDRATVDHDGKSSFFFRRPRDEETDAKDDALAHEVNHTNGSLPAQGG